MSDGHQLSAKSCQLPVYQIRVKGHLDLGWSTWFGDMVIRREANGDTTVTGPVVDQAALHGLLRQVRDLGLQLQSVTMVNPDRGAQ